MIKNIILDIGMVLANFRYRDYMKDLGFSEELQEIFCSKIVENPLWSELDLGMRDSNEIVEEMKSRVLEYPSEAEQFFGQINEIVETFPYARSWILELKKQGYRVYLLSNYPKEIFAMHAKEKFTFCDIVDGKVISGYVKLAKPDPAIYELLCMLYNLKPEECVFLDDRADNILSAKEVGMQVILFTGYEQARSDLEKLLSEQGTLSCTKQAQSGKSLPGDVAAEGSFRMDHYAISVSNMEASRTFYEKLGFHPVKDYQAEDGSVRIVQMDKEGFLLEMFCYPDSEPTPDFTDTLNKDLHVNGAKHMALAVENPATAAEYLLREGLVKEMPVINEGRLGRPYFFIKDPDGIFIEIITGR